MNLLVPPITPGATCRLCLAQEYNTFTAHASYSPNKLTKNIFIRVFFKMNLLFRMLIFLLVFLFFIFSITWQVSVNQDLLPGNMILTEVILQNKKQIY